MDTEKTLIVTGYSIDAIPFAGGSFAGGFASPEGKPNGYIARDPAGDRRRPPPDRCADGDHRRTVAQTAIIAGSRIAEALAEDTQFLKAEAVAGAGDRKKKPAQKKRTFPVLLERIFPIEDGTLPVADPMRDQGNTAMKAFVLAAVFFGVASVLLWPPPAANASPPPPDSVRICAFDDYERWRRDHPRPAAKPLADLNVGEPRTVRMIYFLPNDWSYRAEVVDSMKTVIKQSQTFYREQMQAHGYGDWTFGIETDAQGEPLVHRVDGQHPFSHYDNTLGTAVVAELEQTFDLDANIYFIVLGTDALRQGDGNPAGGVGRRRTKNGGELVVPDDFSFFTVTHELGHTFGLYHDFRDNRYIMSYGGDTRGVLSTCAAEFLSVHTCFNPASPIEAGTPPTVAITSPTRYQPGTTSVPVQLQVSDSEGLHQVGLIGTSNWCRGLTRQEVAAVEFSYDGSFSALGFTNLSSRPKHHLLIVAVDAKGNVSKTSYSLAEVLPYEIATIEGPLDIITSVAFSPDGALLAYGSKADHPRDDARVMLWDMETRENTPIANTKGLTFVAFSRWQHPGLE